VKTYKGFDKNLKCRDFQYEIGKEYELKESPKCCNVGFHSCENPLDVFSYYSPGQGNRFCEVVAGGKVDRHEEDSKVASSKITIGSEISFKTIVEASVRFVFNKCKWKKSNNTTGDRSGSQATGDRSGSQATGYQSGSQATGYKSGSQATGDQSGSQATGDRSGSQATGYRAMSTTNGIESRSQITNTKEIKSKNSIACAFGKDSIARAPIGNWIIISEWDNGNIKTIKTAKVDGKKIKANTWYKLKNGRFVRA